MRHTVHMNSAAYPGIQSHDVPLLGGCDRRSSHAHQWTACGIVACGAAASALELVLTMQSGARCTSRTSSSETTPKQDGVMLNPAESQLAISDLHKNVLYMHVLC